MQELRGSHLCQDHTEGNKSQPQHTLHEGALPLSAELHALDVYSEGNAKLPCTRHVPRRHCRTATH